MSLKNYKKVKYLGKGSYGAAILVESKTNRNLRFVIKEIVIGHMKPHEQEEAKKEADVLHKMNHSNIVMYIESFVENSKLYIVMELADGGDLGAAVAARKPKNNYWTEEEAMRIFVQICLALKHVHDQNILHRDLKSQNIFLTVSGVVKLGDFGIAKVLQDSVDQAQTQIGTPYYLSPEICENKPYGQQSDIWSLGIILYELLALVLPFQAGNLPALVVRICTSNPNYSILSKRYSNSVVELDRAMLNRDSTKRPLIREIVGSKYVVKHISKLLSYTLTKNNGGGGSGQPNRLVSASELPARGDNDSMPPTAEGDEGEEKVTDVDPDIADRQIEEERARQKAKALQRAKEERDATKAEERRQHREQESEKLRQFRENMKRMKAEEKERRQSQGNDDLGGDDTIVVAAKPYHRPSQIQNDAREMKRNFEKDGGDEYVRHLPPVAADSAQSHAGHGRVSESRLNYNQIKNMESNDDIYGGGRVAAAAPRSGVKSLAELRAEREAKFAEDSRRNFMENQQLAQRIQANHSHDHVQSGLLKLRKEEQERLKAEVNNMRANIPYDNHVGNKYERNNNQMSNGDSYARREYFKNRAVAQRMKAMHDPIYGTSDNQVDQTPTYGNARYQSDRDAYQNRGSYDRHYSEVPTDPEERIAFLKAEKEAARQRELAQKDEELKRAHYLQQQERRRLEEKRNALASEQGSDKGMIIGVSGVSQEGVYQTTDDSGYDLASSGKRSGSAVNGSGENVAYIPSAGAVKRSIPQKTHISNDNNQQWANDNQDKFRNDRARAGLGSASGSASVDELPRIQKREAVAFDVMLDEAAVPQKKGWGPPIGLEEIRRSNNSKSTASPIINRGGSRLTNPTVSSSKNDKTSRTVSDTAVESSDYSSNSAADKPCAAAPNVNSNSKQQQAREQAKDVLKKLREQKRQERLANPPKKPTPTKGAKPPIASPLIPHKRASISREQQDSEPQPEPDPKREPLPTAGKSRDPSPARNLRLTSMLNNLSSVQQTVDNLILEKAQQQKGAKKQQKNDVVFFEDKQGIQAKGEISPHNPDAHIRTKEAKQFSTGCSSVSDDIDAILNDDDVDESDHKPTTTNQMDEEEDDGDYELEKTLENWFDETLPDNGDSDNAEVSNLQCTLAKELLEVQPQMPAQAREWDSDDDDIDEDDCATPKMFK